MFYEHGIYSSGLKKLKIAVDILKLEYFRQIPYIKRNNHRAKTDQNTGLCLWAVWHEEIGFLVLVIPHPVFRRGLLASTSASYISPYHIAGDMQSL
jgi:hypothetical protein